MANNKIKTGSNLTAAECEKRRRERRKREVSHLLDIIQILIESHPPSFIRYAELQDAIHTAKRLQHPTYDLLKTISTC